MEYNERCIARGDMRWSPDFQQEIADKLAKKLAMKRLAKAEVPNQDKTSAEG